MGYQNGNLICTKFAELEFMFLTPPTIGELQNLDLPTLIDMLVKQTAFYTSLVKDEGFSGQSDACRQTINNIQAAIEFRQNLEKQTTETISNITLVQDNTQTPVAN